MRGQRFLFLYRSRLIRIIPARAGPTESRYSRRCRVADHPRSCGANLRGSGNGWAWCGSSPLVRGQLDDSSAYIYTLRIIPARAGPTPFLRPRPGFMPDHPRSCGANFLQFGNDGFDFGSSPLVRGQHDFLNGRTIVQRIIPARAGPTFARLWKIAALPDHPRSCGANVSVSICHCYSPGSSPLVRGQRFRLPCF